MKPVFFVLGRARPRPGLPRPSNKNGHPYRPLLFAGPPDLTGTRPTGLLCVSIPARGARREFCGYVDSKRSQSDYCMIEGHLTNRVYMQFWKGFWHLTMENKVSATRYFHTSNSNPPPPQKNITPLELQSPPKHVGDTEVPCDRRPPCVTDVPRA